MTEKDSKKQVPLRLSTTLWNEINKWADDEFRSINGQIEYILSEAVRKRKHAGLNETSESKREEINI